MILNGDALCNLCNQIKKTPDVLTFLKHKSLVFRFGDSGLSRRTCDSPLLSDISLLIALCSSSVIITGMVDRPRRYRWIRVAVSAVCLAMFVGLIGLWVRNYAWRDGVSYVSTNSRLTQVVSNRLGISYARAVSQNTTGSAQWAFATIRTHDTATGFVCEVPEAIPDGMLLTLVILPHWFLAIIAAALAFIPWLPWWSTRFSLRTLLIVTTLVAVVLGLVVWAIR